MLANLALLVFCAIFAAVLAAQFKILKPFTNKLSFPKFQKLAMGSLGLCFLGLFLGCFVSYIPLLPQLFFLAFFSGWMLYANSQSVVCWKPYVNVRFMDEQRLGEWTKWYASVALSFGLVYGAVSVDMITRLR